MFPKIQTASKLEAFLAKSFGKINKSEDSGIVTVISKWRGKYYVLSQTHAQQSVQADAPRRCLCGEPATINNAWCEACFPDTGRR